MVKKTVLIIWILSLVILIMGLFFPIFNSIFYWVVFLSGLISVRILKIKIGTIFLIFFSLFSTSAIISSFNPGFFAEIIMKYSFIFLIIGYIEGLIEYKSMSHN